MWPARVIIGLCIFGITQVAFCEGVKIEGRLTYTVNLFRKSPLVFEKNFQIVTDGCVARIKVNHGSDTPGYTEAGMDGKTIYTVSQFQNTNGSVKATNYSGIVEERESPRDDGSNISYLWLAFGSRCLLTSRTNHYLRPVWTLDDPRLTLEDYRLPATWELLEPGGLPRMVNYFGDGYWHVVMQNRREALAMPPPFNSRFTNAVYKVHVWTNFAHMVLPTACSFTRFGVQNAALARQFEAAVVSHSEFAVTSLSPNSGKISIKPIFSGSLIATDTRFTEASDGITKITYRVEDGKWPSNDVFQ
jgi:hypothetical protein